MWKKKSPSEQTSAHLLPAEKWHLFSTAFSLERTSYWVMSQAVYCSSVIHSLRHTWITFNSQWSKFNSYWLYECAVVMRTEIVLVYVLKFTWYSFWCSVDICFSLYMVCVCVHTQTYIYIFLHVKKKKKRFSVLLHLFGWF